MDGGAPKKFITNLRSKEMQVRTVLENTSFGSFYAALERISQLTNHCVTHGIVKRF